MNRGLGLSRWTKRRRLVKSAAGTIQQIIDEKQNDKDINESVDKVVDQTFQICVEENYVTNSLSCDDTDSHVDDMYNVIDGSIGNNLDMLEVLSGNGGATPESVNFNVESDIENPDSYDDDISNSLAQWSMTHKITVSALSGLLDILKPHFPNLPKDPRTLLTTNTLCSPTPMSPGEYFHFGVSQGIVKTLDVQPNNPIFDDDIILLQVNIDGLPLFKSTNVQLWPILCIVTKISAKSPFIAGLYCGNSKPDELSEYLKEFVEEMIVLENEGFLFRNKLYRVKLSAVICDAPARAYVKNIKNHNSYNGCERCTQEGEYSTKMSFPQVDAAPRNDTSFKNLEYEGHQHGPSPLSQLSVGLVSQFPLDYMHLVCLGVVRRLIIYWYNGPFKARLSSRIRSAISIDLENLVEFTPSEFARKPRSLNEYKRWKATEFRQFLLYTGPVVLCNKLPSNLYSHFLLLSCSIRIMLSPAACFLYSDYAGELLKIFVKNFSTLYESEIVYNVHSLVHLSDDVKKYGTLDNVSAFPFENFLGSLKKMVHKPQYPIQQVFRRLSEINTPPTEPLKNYLGPKHFAGPLLCNLPCESQFKSVCINNETFSLKRGDNCVSFDGEIGVIQNIILSEGVLYALVKKFRHACDFFEYPVKSSFLGIYKVSQMAESLVKIVLDNNVQKCTLYPHNDVSISFPLLHTQS